MDEFLVRPVWLGTPVPIPALPSKQGPQRSREGRVVESRAVETVWPWVEDRVFGFPRSGPA